MLMVIITWTIPCILNYYSQTAFHKPEQGANVYSSNSHSTYLWSHMRIRTMDFSDSTIGYVSSAGSVEGASQEHCFNRAQNFWLLGMVWLYHYPQEGGSMFWVLVG
jgi:hypothetical protein